MIKAAGNVTNRTIYCMVFAETKMTFTDDVLAGTVAYAGEKLHFANGPFTCAFNISVDIISYPEG